MEWRTLQHLNLQLGVLVPPQPHCAAFHHSQAVLAVAAGRHILEFDILTGSKLASIDIGTPVLRMAYSPAGGHVVVAVLEDFTIKAWDLDTEHVAVLYSPPDRRGVGANAEVHMALTPLRPWLFFGAHRRTSVNVVGTVEGVKQAAKIKADVKKPIVQLACHPRNPVLYVAYADGLVKGYNIHTFSVVYSLLDASLRLVGAGALAFHSTLEWIFVGDRGGTLLAWDVSVPARPNLIGTVQASQGNAVATLSWHSMHNLLIAVAKDGSIQVWRPRVLNNPNRSQLRANFFEAAGMEALDLTKILAHGGRGSVYPLPRIVDFVVHPKLNFATVLFSSVSTGGDVSRTRGAPVSREARRQLFAVLQGARGSSVSVIKEKLAVLGSVTNILADQQQLMAQGRGSQLTTSDFARKAFLYGGLSEGHGKGGPLLTVPLLTVSDPSSLLRDIPVCQPFDLELRFFNAETAIFQYPVRAFFMDGCNLMGYNLSSGEYNTLKKLSPYSSNGTERSPKHMLYSAKQHLFLICCECRGGSNEVIMYRDPVAAQVVGDRVNTVAGRDAAFIGSKDRFFAVLDDNGEELIVMALELEFGSVAGGLDSISADADTLARPSVSATGARPSFGVDGQKSLEDNEVESNGTASYGVAGNAALDPLAFSELGQTSLPTEVPRADGGQGSQETAGTFFFQSPVDRIFSTPLEAMLVYVRTGSHIGLARIFPDSYAADRQILPTNLEEGRSVELKSDESVLHFRWQETPSGFVAGVLTTLRVLIVSANLEVICSSWTTFDKSFPPFRSLLWAGPALLFSTATAVFVLGWDGLARSILSIGTPNFALAGVLNDRLLLACANEPNPRQKQGVDIKTRLVGLLEPLLIGWSTYQQYWDPKLDLSEILYQLTSRFDSVRITPRSLDVLVKGAPVCADLAVELAQAGPQFSQELRCKYAVDARRFSLALSILKDEYVRSREYPRCPPTSRLFGRFKKLGEACIKYGQFDKAKEAFEVVSDFESMFDLFICHSNPSAMRRLAQKLDETGADMELKRQVDRVLLVWSEGWARGGVFANLAAESMLPKGPEWAGGNWEIRISAPVKNVSEWELSNEVTAYMKTANGAIPTMIPDHIGVYLGTLRGRGTVVEVRENMLVKRLGQTPHEENGVDNLGGSGRSGSSISRNSDDWSQSGTKPKKGVSGDEAEVDEQARAAEEFKKGQFGVENTSSDEEDGVKEKKRLSIRIRDKPAAGATIDINKVKAATQTFKLNDGVPKPPRRIDPAHDFFGGFASPTPSYAQTTQSFPHPALPPAGPMMGVGPGGAAIPEDFFKETIQAGTVAIPPGGPSYPPPQAQPPGNFQGVQGFSVPPQGQYMATDGVTIFGASEPFQATPHSIMGQGVLPPPQGFGTGVPPPQGFGTGVLPAQGFGTGVPPQAQQGVVTDFGFSDGGVPPSSAGAVPGQGQMNLGSFEAKGGVPSTSSLGPLESLGSQPGKPPISGRPSSPQKRYKPGQVPRGASASQCFKAGVAHVEQNQLVDAMSCFDEAFLALAKDQSLGVNVKAQAPICARYKIAVLLLQEIARLQNVVQGNAGAKEEMARLARHLSSLPLQAKHRINCLRTAIKRNMDVQNFAFAKKLLDLLLSKAPSNKQDELKVLIQICVQRGLTDRTIEETEDPSQFCAATLGRLPTIGHDSCDVCGSKFSALNSPGCTICGMGTVQRSDAASGVVASPFV